MGRVASIVLRAGALVNLILGFAVWAGWAESMVLAHMVLGLVVIVAAWTLALPEATAPGGNRAVAVAAVVLGLLLPVIGMLQLSVEPGAAMWAMRALHVLTAIGIIGVGEAAVARRRRAVPAPVGLRQTVSS
ncbi:MAG: hypothetical protein M3442_04795 [Chloroflexota bacterium]|nr:hypothetical protein [Chloroflexota bacterium]